MVALFGYMPGWQGYVVARRGYVHGWQGYVVALLVESVPGRGGACPVERLFLAWQEGFAGFDRLVRLVGLVGHPGHPGPLDSLSSNTA